MCEVSLQTGTVRTLAEFPCRPRYAAFAAAGPLYITCRDHTLRSMNAHGELELVAGEPGVEGHEDGVAREARFDEPSGVVAVDSGRVLVIADFENDCLRSYDIGTRRVTTLVGEPRGWNWNAAAGAGTDDGIGAGAKLSGPLGLAVAVGTEVAPLHEAVRHWAYPRRHTAGLAPLAPRRWARAR